MLATASAVIPARTQQIIEGWDLSRIKDKMRGKGYGDKELLTLEREYKRYLLLVTKYSKSLPISKPVDEMWHTHILFTEDYACLGAAVGGFIHHKPAVTPKERENLAGFYDHTLALYERDFGPADPRWWPKNQQVCMGSDGEGGCSNQCSNSNDG